jgi:hypothetical protein
MPRTVEQPRHDGSDASANAGRELAHRNARALAYVCNTQPRKLRKRRTRGRMFPPLPNDLAEDE